MVTARALRRPTSRAAFGIHVRSADDKQKAVADVMKKKTLSGIGGPNNVLLRSRRSQRT